MATLDDINRLMALKQAQMDGEEVLDSDQIWIEDPVSFKEFCESKAYLDLFPLSERQYFDAEQLLGTDPKQTFSPRRENDILILVYGKGGGKDEVAARISAYLCYLLQCMANPQEYLFGIKSKATLHILNVAKKGRQAEKVFFKYFSSFVLGSRWFKDHFDIIHKSQKHSEVTKRSRYRGKITIRKDGAEFPKNVECLAETTENESWEGYNPVFFVLDEISGFTSAVELEKAWAIFNTAQTSVTSRVTRTFRGLGMAISYPRQDEGDVILDLYRMSKTFDGMYGSLAYPWHSKGLHNYGGESFIFKHPRLDHYFGIEDVGVEVPVEYQKDFERNPEDSMTKYLCVARQTKGGWLEYPERLKELESNGDPTHPKYRQRLFETRDVIKETYDVEGRAVRYLQKQLIKCRPMSQAEKYEMPRVAWVDSAQKHCDATVIIGHMENRTIQTHEGPLSIEVVVQDDELIWRPDAERGIQVSLKNIEYWLTDIIPNNIRLVSVGADQWNSAELEESLRDRQIFTEIHDVNLDDYTLTKRQIYLGALDILNGEAYGQLSNLVNAGVKSKPTKKPGFLQDVADGVVGIVRLLVGRDKKGRTSLGRRATVGMPVGIMLGSGGPPPAMQGMGGGIIQTPQQSMPIPAGPGGGSGVRQIPVRNPNRGAPATPKVHNQHRRMPAPLKL